MFSLHYNYPDRVYGPHAYITRQEYFICAAGFIPLQILHKHNWSYIQVTLPCPVSEYIVVQSACLDGILAALDV